MPQGPKELHERVVNDFTLHPPLNEDIAIQMDEVRAKYLRHGLFLVAVLPPGRELSSALTALEESCFWAIGAIARNQ
jgi:hypothetical protein